MSNTQKSKPAVQLVLGSQAISFPLVVTVKKLDGTDSVLTLTCKAMRKTEWAKLRDDYHAAILRAAVEQGKANAQQAKAAAVASADSAADASTDNEATATHDFAAEHGLQSLVARGLKTDADLVAQFATDWDLETELTSGSLQELEDEFGGTLAKAISAYEAAIYQGRLGN